MLQQIGHKKWRVYAYDVESHNDNESIAKNETSIWLSSFIDENNKEEDESSYFYTIESWLDFLDRETSHKRTKKAQPHNNILVFIYNLSFEWSFILPVIIAKKFQWKERITPDDSYCFTSVTTKSISSVWTATLKFSKNGGQVVLRDLSKIFMGGLGNVAKAFKLPTQKGEIDYTMNRLHGHIVTKEEKHYNFCDCRIIIDILLKLKEDKDMQGNYDELEAQLKADVTTIDEVKKAAHEKAMKAEAEKKRQTEEAEKTEKAEAAAQAATVAAAAKSTEDKKEEKA